MSPDPSPIEPPRPAAAPKPAYRLAIPSVALLLYGALASLWYWGPHSIYFAVLRLFAVNPFRFPFLDISAVLAAAQCRRLWDRRLSLESVRRARPPACLFAALAQDYPQVFWTRARRPPSGLGLDLLFIASLAALCRPTRAPRQRSSWRLSVLSPMTVFALERANIDLVIFLLIFAGCALGRTVSRAWRFGGLRALFLCRSAQILSAGAAGADRPRAPARRHRAGGDRRLPSCCSWSLYDRPELVKALANLPRPSYFTNSFAAVNLPFGLAEVLLTTGPFRLLIGIPSARHFGRARDRQNPAHAVVARPGLTRLAPV